jgi:methylated-DNA-[protein]-cysteine S-methyltransferase
MDDMETVVFNSGGRAIHATFSDKGLCGMRYEDRESKATSKLPGPAAHLKEELDRYFAGIPISFTTALDLDEVTGFRRKVYEELRRIPYGTTASYGEIAERAGSPNGARAVGQANRRNPIGIIIA